LGAGFGGGGFLLYDLQQHSFQSPVLNFAEFYAAATIPAKHDCKNPIIQAKQETHCFGHAQSAPEQEEEEAI
jgi:hypothetical protein